VEDLIRWLQARGYSIEALVEQDAVGRLATARLTRSLEPASPVIDLLFASSGIEPEIVAEADMIELLPRLRIRVATTAHLIALKVLARDDMTRPQDAGDLRALTTISPSQETRRRQQRRRRRQRAANPSGIHQFRPRAASLRGGGADDPSNMQWQTIAEAKAKDKTERIGCR
jgi:hypothetical protein